MGIGLLLIVGVVVWLLWSQRSAQPNQTASFTNPFTPAQPKQDTAEQIVRERLARGEIDRAEYDTIMKALHA